MMGMLLACSDRKHAAPVDLLRLDRYIHDCRSRSDSARALYAPALKAFMTVLSHVDADDDAFVDSLSLTAPVKVFTPEVYASLSSLDSLAQALGDIRARLAELLPQVSFPAAVAAIVSPYESSLFVVDSVMLIGLNHYLGADHPAYQSFDAYKRPFKTIDYLPYEVTAKLIRQAFPYTPPADASLLNRLLYEGAVAYAVSAIVPDSDCALALAIDPRSFDEVVANERFIYSVLITHGLLYSTSRSDESRLVSPAPASPLISPSAPGRAACYVGLRIVEAYLRSHPGASLQWLLSPAFYGSAKSFIDSSYKPRN